MSIIEELRSVARVRVIQLLALVLLLVLVAGLLIQERVTVLDRDLWWHMGVGNWIIGNHAVPRTTLFSWTMQDRPWIAYSWLAEVVFAFVYAKSGIIGTAFFGIALSLSAAAILFWMLHWLAGDFWLSWLLTAVASFAFVFSLAPPRPVFFSMILYTAEIAILLNARKTGNSVGLRWLPIIFCLWANLHIQFIYGIGVLALFVVVTLVERALIEPRVEDRFFSSTGLSAPILTGVLMLCLGASCIGPYTYHPYQVVLEYSRQAAPYVWISELQSLDFKNFTHYILLLLAAGAFIALGWHKKTDFFKTALLVLAAIIAFRTRRDSWFLGISAAAVIADCRKQITAKARFAALKFPELASVTSVLILFVLLVAHEFRFNNSELSEVVRGTFPVDAVDYLKRNPVKGPLFNNLAWGGYLIWSLPELPVSVDGRTDVYGDEFINRAMKTELGESYKLDPTLSRADVVLLSKKIPLTYFISRDKRYRLLYEDQISAIFVRQMRE